MRYASKAKNRRRKGHKTKMKSQLRQLPSAARRFVAWSWWLRAADGSWRTSQAGVLPILAAA